MPPNGGWYRWLSTSRVAPAAAPAAAPASPTVGASSSAAAAAARRQQLKVHTSDGRVFDGRVVALDRTSDLAVVRIDVPGGLAGQPALTPARLGDSAG